MTTLRRYLWLAFHTFGGMLSLLMAVATALLVGGCIAVLLWVQSAGSLEQALRWASPWLPAGQRLQVSGVAGSVKQGGRIEHLVWQQGQLAVELQGVELSWDWQALLGRELRLTKAHVQALRVDDRNPPSKAPLSELLLPLTVDVPFVVERLEWAGPPALQLQNLQGHYRFDGQTHSVQDTSVDMAAGRYSGQARLQARKPMAVSAEVHGTVQTPLQIRQAPLTLTADASAKGTLLGADALIELQAALLPQGEGSMRALGAMQASLQAQLRPAQAQPIANAQARWSALDLATLWPHAPSTRLSGQAQVLPDADGWKADVQLQNSAAGSLDQHRVPLNTAHALVLYRNGQWQLGELKAALAGGTVQAQGAYAGSPARWSVGGTLDGVQPQQIDSRLRWAPLAGRFLAQQQAQGLVFESQLSSVLQGSGAAAQSLQMQAKGSWKDSLLQFDTLQLQTPQASLSGQLQVHTSSYASSASLRAVMPGAQWMLEGKLAEASGQGRSEWQVKDAHALAQWLASLPIVGSRLAGTDAVGTLEGSAQWTGGWQRQGRDMQVQGLLKSPRLELRGSQSQATQLTDVQLDLGGTLHAAVSQLRGKAQLGNTQFDLQAQARGGQEDAGHWQARLEVLRVSALNTLYTAPWIVELQRPVELDWRQNALQQTLRVSEGSLRLSGPAPGSASILWQPVQWAHQGASDTVGSTRWNSKGQLQGLPLAWLELLGQTRLSNLGLRGDLLFGGQWDASGGSALQLRASLQRTSGDLELLGSEGTGNLKAGLRDAHVNLAVDDDAVRAELVWDSEAGGKAQAELTTRVQTVAGSVTWAPDAPLKGSVRASLPRVGAWSLIAPVGWRIQGTLDADAQLSGTRANPAWKGSLAGNAMSVRSVVDGIDLSGGVLRLQVDGQHMEIVQLTLQGAGGSSGGQLQISGSADWLPGTGSTAAEAANRLRMSLQAKADGFRVSAKPDQRLVVSGNLNTQLANARLQVRGALKADQALFVLPDDTAPKLGSDVVVVRKQDPSKPKAPAPAPSPRLAQAVVPDISVTLDPGENFLLQGHGLSTRLTGQLTLKAEGQHATPRLTGELHTVGGTYRAYGQLLNIEEGMLRFSGAYDNPSLSILALRPTSEQVVGVQIGGTAQLPVVRLYSDPDMPEADKLSWLVLGRASANGGAEAAMLQQAALSLLAGKGKAGGANGGLVGAVGLDELSLGQASTTNLDGTTGTEATVKLGKRLSRDFYVSYERSLSGTFGTFYMFYDLSRRLTLRGESGATSAIDLIFTTRFD